MTTMAVGVELIRTPAGLLHAGDHFYYVHHGRIKTWRGWLVARTVDPQGRYVTGSVLVKESEREAFQRYASTKTVPIDAITTIRQP